MREVPSGYVFYVTVIHVHGLINCKNTKTKCHHLKKLTGKGDLWQVFFRAGDTVSHVGIFDPAL
jgi:hypothetical protein